MIIECGPKHDRRICTISLPLATPQFKNKTIEKVFLKSQKLIDNNNIGILVSGGVDSAILYFLLLAENFNTGNHFTIKPYTILRKEGSRVYAIKVINWIHRYYGLPPIELNIVGNNSLPELLQVTSGIEDILHSQVDYVYLGIIQARPEHSIGWSRFEFKETKHIKYPFLKLEKSHVVDLYHQYNLHELFDLTHSCAVHEIVPCNNCNGCAERQWGIDQLYVE